MTGFASCCVLSYERPAFLRDCISSLLFWAKAPLELIVHDDGSTARQVRELLGDWLSIGLLSTVVLNPPGHNQGQGVALNRMFAIAQGDPIIKLDQDLLFEPGWLAAVNELLDCNRQASVRGLEPEIGLLGLLHYHHEPVDSANTLIDQWDGWSSRTHILGSAFAVTRSCWQDLGPFEQHSEAFAEDWEFQKRVTASGRYVCALPDQDLVTNRGMGIGPSTVVIGEGQVQPIHKAPKLQEPDVHVA